MCLIMSIKAYLCQNMINCDVVDFSECRSEEVMFLLMLSVVIILKHIQMEIQVRHFHQCAFNH